MKAGRARILVTGAGGLIGRRVLRCLIAEGRDEILPADGPAADRRVLELEDPAELERGLRDLRPDLVVHAAAITSIAGCEAEPERAHTVNVLATEIIARRLAAAGGRLIFFSTDQVLDGRSGPYADDAPPRPLHAYGRGKAEAERRIQALLPDHVILRPSLVFGPSPGGRRSAHEAILLAAREGRRLGLFTDEFRRPIEVDQVAKTVCLLVRSSFRGRLNVAGSERLSRFDFGRRVCRAFGIDPQCIEARSAAAMNMHPERPLDLDLDTRKLVELHGVPLEGLDDRLERLAGGQGTE